MSDHVVIIGGGISGLAAAEYLSRQEPPPRLTLLEASPRLGGHIRTEQRDGFVMEAGPDVLLAAKPAAIDLAKRVGLESRLVGTSPVARAAVHHDLAALAGHQAARWARVLHSAAPRRVR